MARLGAKVTGIDASEKNIKIAKLHSEKMELKIDYMVSSPEKLNHIENYDVILNLEIVEHVDDIIYIKSLINYQKKWFNVTATLNRSFISYIKAIIGLSIF